MAEAARAIRTREVACVELTGELLDRARVADEQLHCFVGIDGRRAMAVAGELDQALAAGAPSGSLTGVPYAYKDIFVRDGVAPSQGSRTLRLPFRGRDATLLQRLDRAGAVPLGRLNLDQFGYAATGANPDFGDTRNPWDPSCVAGGSSSGAAAAVAAGVLPFAIGSDTGGSVRIPAAFCGIVGLKPTYGRVPKRGAAAMCFSQDTPGVLARSVLDAAIVLDAIAGHDPLDASSVDAPVADHASAASPDPSVRGLRVGVDRAYNEAVADAEVLDALNAALGVLEGAGAEVVDVDLSALPDYDLVATLLTSAEVSAVHAQTFSARPEAYAPATRARLGTARSATGMDHVNALRLQGRALSAFVDGVLSRVELIAMPATPTAAPTLVDALDRAGDDGVSASIRALTLNRAFNLLGLPAMSVPMGFDAAGLPLGLQLVAGPWREARLLRCGAAFQANSGWHLEAPRDWRWVVGQPSGSLEDKERSR
ncbi:Glutamyl-tRNA(Gln) amidotransferase subunit A [Baekduia alba]|nr:Glutamyl-tRNA(Gln) amidotransferase subunit A [Baekduia alba]